MSGLDWKSLVRAVAPTLGSALGTPLAGAAVAAVADAVLGRPGTQAEVSKQLEQGLTPEALAALKEGDRQFAVRLQELGLDAQKLAAQLDQAYIADTQAARDAHKGDSAVLRLGIAVLATFAIIMCGVLITAHELLMGSGLRTTDPGTIAAVFGLVGSVVGYVAANAQQVCAYFFGSSKGSKDKTDALASAIAQVGKRT